MCTSRIVLISEIVVPVLSLLIGWVTPQERLQSVVLPGLQGECTTLNGPIQQNILNNVAEVILNNSKKLYSHNPLASCKDLPLGSPSGNYWILSHNKSAVSLQYCDTSNRCSCNSTGGWMRVANLDMTDPNQQCPPGFRLVTNSSRRYCGRPGSGCVSTTFPVNGVRYSRVCGRIIAYQFASPDGFALLFENSSLTINDPYVDGIILTTHGQSSISRVHIWTFVAARDEFNDNRARNKCPCTHELDRTFDYNELDGVQPSDTFIDNNYFCDTGSRDHWKHEFYFDDPLWDGEGCGVVSTCCSFNNPPWFCRELPQPTTDDIELRLCLDQSIGDEGTPLETVEIYVQ